MEYTIGSLGGVPLGRSGTGAAVTFGKQDYSYLAPEKAKAEKYQPATTQDDLDRITGKVAKVWEPDRGYAKEKLDEWLRASMDYESARKAGDEKRAQDLQKKKVDISFELENIVADSDRFVRADAEYLKAKSGDKSLLLDEEDEQAYQQWRSAPYPERLKMGYKPNVKVADDLNYTGYAMPTMKQLLPPANKQSTKTIIGNQTIQAGDLYYNDDDIRNSAKTFTESIQPGSKWDNYWNAAILNKANSNDGSLEEQMADKIVATKGTPDGDALRKKYIEEYNYTTLKNSLGSQFKIVAPYTPPKAATRAAGAGTAAPKGDINWSSSSLVGLDESGKPIPKRTVLKLEIADAKSDKDESYIVGSEYIMKLYKTPGYEWLANVGGLEYLTNPKAQRTPDVSIKGQVASVYHDPNRTGPDADRLLIALPNKDNPDVRNIIEIPLVKNIAKINQRLRAIKRKPYSEELRDFKKIGKAVPSTTGPSVTIPDLKPPASQAAPKKNNTSKWMKNARSTKSK